MTLKEFKLGNIYLYKLLIVVVITLLIIFVPYYNALLLPPVFNIPNRDTLFSIWSDGILLLFIELVVFMILFAVCYILRDVYKWITTK